LFGTSYIIPFAAEDTLNVTFSANADGSGILNDWEDSIISDEFEVINITITQCLIREIISSPTTTLGEIGSVKMKVVDGKTEQGLVHASCYAEGSDISGLPLVVEPSGSGDQGYKITSADGAVSFQHDMDESFWETNTTYLYQFYCFSLPNVTNVDGQHVAFLEDTGLPAGMKTCTVQALFTTGTEDVREGSSFKIASYFFLALILILLIISFRIMASKMDQDKWFEKVKERYYKRNFIKLTMASVALAFARDSFMVIYVLFLPVVFLFYEIATLSGATLIIPIINALTIIYGIGMLIIIILFFGKIQEIVYSVIESGRNENWGIGERGDKA